MPAPQTPTPPTPDPSMPAPSTPTLPALSHDTLTIISIAVIASACGTLVHEGLGHGLTAYIVGGVPTELTSNHLTALHEGRLVQAGGTLANLIVGTASMLASHRLGTRANLRYFLWVLGALNLLSGAGYFMFSGIFAFGDWNEVIRDLPYHPLLRTGMTIGGALLYGLFVRWLAVEIKPFLRNRSEYNRVGRFPYYAAGLFNTAAGLFDPLGIQLLLVSTIPAAFGGSSGLLWADNLVPRTPPTQNPLRVHRSQTWWLAAALIATTYIAVLGPGIKLH